MSVMRDLTRRLFAPPPATSPAWRVVVWWELRRIPFNIIIGIYGIVCLLIFFWAIEGSGHLQPGEDAVEPMALLLAPFAINLLYTLGWIVEIPARLMMPALSPRLSPMLLGLGIGLGLFLITIPAAFWAGYRLVQVF